MNGRGLSRSQSLYTNKGHLQNGEITHERTPIRVPSDAGRRSSEAEAGDKPVVNGYSDKPVVNGHSDSNSQGIVRRDSGTFIEERFGKVSSNSFSGKHSIPQSQDKSHDQHSLTNGTEPDLGSRLFKSSHKILLTNSNKHETSSQNGIDSKPPVSALPNHLNGTKPLLSASDIERLSNSAVGIKKNRDSENSNNSITFVPHNRRFSASALVKKAEINVPSSEQQKPVVDSEIGKKWIEKKRRSNSVPNLARRLSAVQMEAAFSDLLSDVGTDPVKTNDLDTVTMKASDLETVKSVDLEPQLEVNNVPMETVPVVNGMVSEEEEIETVIEVCIEILH